MLPFHKRSRVNSSIEIGTDEFEAIELPRVRPPSIRPSAFIAAPAYSAPPRYSFDDAEEMTVIRPDKRPSSSPPRHAGHSAQISRQMPRIPPAPPPPRFDDDEPTMLLTSSSRPLLSMSARNVIVASEAYNHEIPPPPPSSRARVAEPPRSAAAVDANASGVLRDLSMTSSFTGSTDVRRMRGRGAAWGMGLVAMGVLAGLVVAFVARGEGIAAAAALIDPSQHGLTADVAKAIASPQSQATTPGAAQPQQAAEKAAAGSCNADAVAAAVVAKVEAHGTQHMEVTAPPKAIEAKPVVAAYVAPRPVVHHVEQPHEPAQVAVAVAAVAAPPLPAVAKPAAKAAKRGDEMESASAADALAKAQLEASLSR